MAELSWPSPTHNSRNVTDREYELLSAHFSDDGVYATPLDTPVVSAGTGLQVVVRAGVYASLRGHAWTSGTTDVPLAITSNASGLARFDWVVLQLDRATWEVRLAVLEGTPGAGTPSITQDLADTGVFEIVLAVVSIPDGAATVTVTPWTQFVGSRIRPANAGRMPSHTDLGEVQYRPDTGAWEGWNGASWRTIHSDTGELSISPGYNTWEQVYANVGRKIGHHVWLRVWVKRVNITFGRADSDGSKIGVLPDVLWPKYHEFFAAKFSGSGGEAHVEVRPDGEIWVTENDSDVTPGRHLAITMNYLV